MSNIIQIQTGILIVNLENFDNSLIKVKNLHTVNLPKFLGPKQIASVSRNLWVGNLSYLRDLKVRDTNVLVGNRDSCCGTIMFLNADLAEKFAVELVKAFEKDLV